MKIPPTRFPRTLEESCGQRSHRGMFQQRPTANVYLVAATIVLLALSVLILFTRSATCLA